MDDGIGVTVDYERFSFAKNAQINMEYLHVPFSTNKSVILKQRKIVITEIIMRLL
jgi:hypothetical protein